MVPNLTKNISAIYETKYKQMRTNIKTNKCNSQFTFQKFTNVANHIELFSFRSVCANSGKKKTFIFSGLATWAPVCVRFSTQKRENFQMRQDFFFALQVHFLNSIQTSFKPFLIQCFIAEWLTIWAAIHENAAFSDERHDS